MGSMEEIIEIEEIQEEIDETLKKFMSEDEEAEVLLKNKINELIEEENKLSNKEAEVKKLEESSREKISTNASPEELIEIAGKLKEAQDELLELTENIKNLESEREELETKKKEIDNSKQEYIKSLNSTNLSFEEQLRKISEAIEVCDNPTLKQVLEDVKSEKDKLLTDLQEKRNNELKSVLNDVSDNEKEVEEANVISTPIDDVIVNTPEVVNEEITDEIVKPIFEENVLEQPVNDVINLDSILSNIEENKVSNDVQDFNVITPDNLIIPNIEENNSGIKIIFEKDVPESLIRDIYSSSYIVPKLNDYLNESSNKGGII